LSKSKNKKRKARSVKVIKARSKLTPTRLSDQKRHPVTVKRTDELSPAERERYGLRASGNIQVAPDGVVRRHVTELSAAEAARYGLDPDHLRGAVDGTNTDDPPRTAGEKAQAARRRTRAAEALARYRLVHSPEHSPCVGCSTPLRKGTSLCVRRAYPPDGPYCRRCAEIEGLLEEAA
jgi:hypothetical protein